MLGLKGKYLLVVGQNQPSKAHEVALRAFVAAALPEVSLVFVQRLRTGAALAELASELGVADAVRFVGTLAQAELIALMQSATALLQTSASEGFGLPMLEAAACGCPVIASDLPVLREVMGRAAHFVPFGDISLWAQAMRKVTCEVDLQRALSGSGQARALEFDWDQTAKRTLQVYRDALQNH
jgi:alpha-1,3-rhamnosyl/mannosyltransferase